MELEAFQTSLPLRLDYEAMMAYVLLPPAGGVFLLLMEHKSDYVRFHAWQSSMLFTVIFIVHLIFAWSTVISWMLFAVDLILIAFLAMHAYRDGEDAQSRGQVPKLTVHQLKRWTISRSRSLAGWQIRLLMMSEALLRALHVSRHSFWDVEYCSAEEQAQPGYVRFDA